MTQTLRKYGLIMFFFAAGSLASIGCVPAEINHSDSSDAKVSTETSVDETSETDCCSQCATEQNVLEKADGCCGKCESETSATPGKTTTNSCHGECNAFSNGDSNN